MSVPTEYSTYCRKKDCELYNVESYCVEHLVLFFKWINKKKLKLTKDNFESLWERFDNE